MSAAGSARIDWAIAQLDLAPKARVLEFGCGNGLAAEKLCSVHPGLTLVAIDRSATSVQRASLRLQRHLESGNVTLQQVALADLDVAHASFDLAFGINVNVFWTSPATTELRVLRRALMPGGRLVICFGPAPVEHRQSQILASVAEHVGREGFVDVSVSAEPAGSAVRARRPG